MAHISQSLTVVMRLAVATHCQEHMEDRVSRMGEGEDMLSVHLVCTGLMQGPSPSCSHPILLANLRVRAC